MTKSIRRRGVILSSQGSRKLIQTKSDLEVQQNQRYTLESLSEKIGLTPNTISKVFTCSSGVDKRTLKCCFQAFNLTLTREDYVYLQSNQENLEEINPIPPAKTCLFPKLTYSSSLHLLPYQNNSLQGKKMVKPPQKLQSHLPKTPGGQMPLDSVFYIDRPIIQSLCYKSIQQPGTLLNICAPKQMGKTSLMIHIIAFAKSLGYQTFYLNLQLVDLKILQNLESFLQWFCARVTRELKLSQAHSNEAIYHEQITPFWQNSLGNKSIATDYFNDIILAQSDRPLVIAIDELNQLFTYPDIACEFLQLLRAWSGRTQAGETESHPWQKLRLLTIYSTEIMMPSSINPSLLNTGRLINLPEFTSAQVQELAQRYQQEITESQIQQLITILGGHPYRLQLAFYSLYQQTITLEAILENSDSLTVLYAEHLQQQWWNLQHYDELLPIFTKIVNNPKPIKIKLSLGYQLQKMGLVRLKGNLASLYCELFRPFFMGALN
ncbi:MAG: AAA-like domain-containing protein [Trichodesmium sp. St16_bin4-tuft]|nr:AAA-like domain-containing protein [Trichodesmium sp. St16_bin4-tuft]